VGLIANWQMRVSPTPPPVGPRPALPDQDGNHQKVPPKEERQRWLPTWTSSLDPSSGLPAATEKCVFVVDDLFAVRDLLAAHVSNSRG
jgi:hypothetical protein